VRWHSWCHFYSPQPLRVNLDWQPLMPDDQDVHRLCSWGGMPGTGFGAMESRAASAMFRQRYRSETRRTAPEGALQIRLLDVPMAAWSSHGFEGMGLSLLPPASVVPLQADTLNQLRGVIRSPVSFRLRDCGLYFDRWYYELGTLEPGAGIQLTPRNQPLDLKARLTRKRIVDAKEVTSPWDPAGTDLARIAEMIMFHQAAGGTLFTGLKHEFRDRLDMSAHLLLQSAIVVGRPTEPVAGFSINEAPQPLAGDRRATFVRFTVPVEPSRGPRS